MNNLTTFEDFILKTKNQNKNFCVNVFKNGKQIINALTPDVFVLDDNIVFDNLFISNDLNIIEYQHQITTNNVKITLNYKKINTFKQIANNFYFTTNNYNLLVYCK